jgi:hypothetical protein
MSAKPAQQVAGQPAPELSVNFDLGLHLRIGVSR